MGWNDTTPGIPFCSAARRKRSSFDGVLKTAGEVLTGGLVGLLCRFGPGVDGNGKALPGRMKDATDENKVETADRAEISAEPEDMELCARLRDASDDLRTHQENVSFTFSYFSYFSYFSQVKKVQKPESTEYLPQEIPFTLFRTFCTLIHAF